MVLHIISTVLNTKFCRPVDMICRKIVSIIYNPYMLITIYILGHTTFRFFEQAERIVSFSKNIQLNLVTVFAVNNILNCLEILRLGLRSFRHNQMIFRLDSDGFITPFFHPALLQIAFFQRLQTHDQSPPVNILER